VPDYYLYLFNSKGALRKRVVLTKCKDDDEARDVAAARPHHHGMELWEGARFIESFDPVKRT
jgi:hypothetical protein